MDLEKVINQLKKFSLYYLDGYDEIEEHETKKAIEVVLKELEERIGLETERNVLRSEVSALKADKKYFKKESEKKDKVIDEMAGMINTHNFDDICKEFGKYENCSNYIKEGLCKKCIKEYFYKKVEDINE